MFSSALSALVPLEHVLLLMKGTQAEGFRDQESLKFVFNQIYTFRLELIFEVPKTFLWKFCLIYGTLKSLDSMIQCT